MNEPTVEFEVTGGEKVKVKVSLNGKTIAKDSTMEDRHETSIELAKLLLG